MSLQVQRSIPVTHYSKPHRLGGHANDPGSPLLQQFAGSREESLRTCLIKEGGDALLTPTRGETDGLPTPVLPSWVLQATDPLSSTMET